MEYIEKKKAVDAVFNGCGACTEEIEDLPAIDIVRCKDCAHMIKDGICDYFALRTAAEEFCSHGKERSE